MVKFDKKINNNKKNYIKFENSHRHAHLITDQMTEAKSLDGNKIQSESETESCFQSLKKIRQIQEEKMAKLA